MNVAAPPSTQLPNHFAPPSRLPSTRRPQYHHPTLHKRTGSRNSQQFLAYEHPPTPPTPPAQYSPPPVSQQFQRTPSTDRTTSPQPRRHSGGPPQYNLQRESTGGSSKSNSLVQYVPKQAGHRRQTDSTSTSNSSMMNRIPSGHAHYPPMPPPPSIPSRPDPHSQMDTYVARLRRAKATVWSARGQREDLDRSNSKEDKYKKKGDKRAATMRVLFTLDNSNIVKINLWTAILVILSRHRILSPRPPETTNAPSLRQRSR